MVKRPAFVVDRGQTSSGNTSSLPAPTTLSTRAVITSHSGLSSVSDAGRFAARRVHETIEHVALDAAQSALDAAFSAEPFEPPHSYHDVDGEDSEVISESSEDEDEEPAAGQKRKHYASRASTLYFRNFLVVSSCLDRPNVHLAKCACEVCSCGDGARISRLAQSKHALHGLPANDRRPYEVQELRRGHAMRRLRPRFTSNDASAHSQGASEFL